MIESLQSGVVELVVASEPYFIHDKPSWISDTEGKVAIIQAPPSWSLQDFDQLLDEVGGVVRRHAHLPTFVLGDLNVHSTLWNSSRTNQRGHSTMDWAASINLKLLNHGDSSTCVRQQGESKVDLSFANSAAARRVTKWIVDTAETLSDYIYIRISVSKIQERRTATKNQNKWSLRRMDDDLFMAATLVATWPDEPTEEAVVESEADWFTRTSCDKEVESTSLGRAARNFAREPVGASV
ncbi:uncharacterized protein LOC143432480 [Xylocopa sonorina]|uniref:uncharacterized protein LOC143432235 n=1 Tax=Xylocopa sonorina TaxID=1818115 RepID=UPI00403ABCFB